MESRTDDVQHSWGGTCRWWTEALRNWTSMGVEFSGIWLDMNEASSFCDGSWCVVIFPLNWQVLTWHFSRPQWDRGGPHEHERSVLPSRNAGRSDHDLSRMVRVFTLQSSLFLTRANLNIVFCPSRLIDSYNSTISGPSGNITVNGVLTCNQTAASSMAKRGLGAAVESDISINTPPYAIHNGQLKFDKIEHTCEDH